VLLYEMLTGHRAFQGESKLATLAAILNLEPEPLEKLNAGVPHDLVRIVQRCLRKDPDRRAHSMRDLKLALEEIKEDSDSGRITTRSAAPGVIPRSRSRQPLLIAAALAVILAAGGGAAAFWFWHGTARIEPTFQATPLTAFPGYESSPSFSPDGAQVAFAWNGEAADNYDIYVQLIGSGRPLRLTTDPARDVSPVWSRDGRSIAFARLDAVGNATIMLIPALGGAEREIAQLGPDFSLMSSYSINLVFDWSPDGRWLVISKRDGPNHPFELFLLSVETGEKRRLTSAPGTTGDFGGKISPDGKALAFVRMQKGVGSRTFISDIYTIPLSSDFQPAGEALRLTSDNTTIHGIVWAAGGAEIVFSSSRGGAPALWRTPVSGSDKPRRVLVGDNASSLAISPHANRLVYEQSVSVDSNIWRVDLSGAATTAPASFIASTRQEESAEYSPDGKRIVFRSDRSGSLEIWTCNADGSNLAQLTTRPTSGSPHWSPDSSQIAFDSTVDGQWEIFVVPARGGQPRQVTSGGGTRPTWSRDGSWIYYASVHSGRTEVWKTPASTGKAVQLSKNGGNNPAGSDDGKYVYYDSATAIVRSTSDGAGETDVVTDASTGAPFAVTHDGIYYRAARPSRDLRFFSFATGKSHTILKLSLPPASGISVSPDGHSLLYSQIDGAPGSDLILVENFR
jgi:Tol biopolymer transport system component